MANSNNVLLITSEFPPQPGGIGNHAYNLALYLTRSGYDVTILTDIRSSDGREENDFDKTLPFKINRVKRRNLIVFTYLKRVKETISSAKKNDIILVSGKFSLWMVNILKLLSSKTIIAIVHGSELQLKGKAANKLTTKSLQKCKRVIAVSNFTKSLLPDLLKAKTEVIANGFSLDVPSNTRQTSKPVFPKLITVGNVTQRKGQKNVINALPKLIEKWPKLEYHIVGIPTDQEKLMNLAKEIGVDKSIFFHGKVSEKTKITLLQESNIFVMLSETTDFGDVEGFGIAILEANALGIPAIGSKKCGIEDAIENRKSGILVSPGNIDEVCIAVEDILNDYQNYSENASAWSTNFRWDVVIEKYIKVLNESSKKTYK